MRKLTTDEFIEKSIEIWGNRFDYSLVEYENNKKKVKIICTKHGEFEQRANNHLNSKYGCTQCGIEREKYNKIEEKRSKKESLKKERKDIFFKKCKEIHNDKYDYSLVEYKNTNSKVKIICKDHGEFEQRASAHTSGQGCPECKFEDKRTGLDEFLIRCKEIHGDKFDYSLITEYINSNTKVKVICKKHGEFLVTPDNHINKKQGCSECKKLGLEGFIEKAKDKWGDRYDYSLVEYKNNKEKVDIICKEHGVFKQRVNDHLRGNKVGCGCPICNEPIGERIISEYMIINNINFERQKKFNGCKYKKGLSFDFYLPYFNTCIEYNGIQHYEPVVHFGGEKVFKNQIIRDSIKKEYCKNNNINLIIIKYDDDINEKLTQYFK